METRVRPSVQEDGGDIFYHGFDPETGKHSCIILVLVSSYDVAIIQ